MEATLSHRRLRYAHDALRAVSHWDDELSTASAIVLRSVIQVLTDPPSPNQSRSQLWKW